MAELTLELMVGAARKQRASRSLPMQPGATDQEIATLVESARETFGVELPPRHLDLLRMTNGMNENALSVFATHRVRDLASDIHRQEFFVRGVVEMNVELRGDLEDLEEFLLFASDDLYHHGQDLKSGEFVVMPHALYPPVEKVFATFDELMIEAFKRRIRPQFWQ